MDYCGYRVVCQTIIPGLLQRVNDAAVVYGSIDTGKNIKRHQRFAELVRNGRGWGGERGRGRGRGEERGRRGRGEERGREEKGNGKRREMGEKGEGKGWRREWKSKG